MAGASWAYPQYVCRRGATDGDRRSQQVRSSSGFFGLSGWCNRWRAPCKTDQSAAHLITPTEVLSGWAQKVWLANSRNAEAGGDAHLARQYSDDIGSAAEGELGWTNPGQMVPEFEATMAAIPLNTISDPFRSEFGWHILEVTDRRDKDFSSEIQRNQVAGYIREQKYQEELEAWLRKIREEAFVDIK